MANQEQPTASPKVRLWCYLPILLILGLAVHLLVLYDSLDVPDPISVVVILGYRLFSFWLPTLLGFAAAAYLSREPSSSAG